MTEFTQKNEYKYAKEFKNNINLSCCKNITDESVKMLVNVHI